MLVASVAFGHSQDWGHHGLDGQQVVISMRLDISGKTSLRRASTSGLKLNFLWRCRLWPRDFPHANSIDEDQSASSDVFLVTRLGSS